MRVPLRKLIFDSWKECIEQDYINQRINSERSLQASFWSHINKNIPPDWQDKRRVFIESPMKVVMRNGSKRVIPDIIICSTKEVIAVIELKYLPRGYPKREKDIKSLAFISKNRHRIIFSNNRFRGDAKKRIEYPLSKNMLFIWASVHAKNKHEVDKSHGSTNKHLADCYVELHAETENNSEPNIYMLKKMF